MWIGEQEFQKVARQVGRRIQQIRKAAGLTQVELEERVKVYDVGAIERGETNATLLTLLRLVTALSVELKDLFSELPAESPESEAEKIRIEVIGRLSGQDVAVQRKALELLRVFLS